MTTAVTQRQEPAGAPPGAGSRRLTERVFRIRESGIIAVLLVFVAVTTSIQPSFLNEQNHYRTSGLRAGSCLLHGSKTCRLALMSSVLMAN